MDANIMGGVSVIEICSPEARMHILVIVDEWCAKEACEVLNRAFGAWFEDPVGDAVAIGDYLAEALKRDHMFGIITFPLNWDTGFDAG